VDPAVRREVDEYLSAAFGLSIHTLHRPGVNVVPAATGDDGVFLYRIGPACVVVVEEEHVDAAAAIVASLDSDAVFSRKPARSLAGDASSVHGPSWHGYLSRLEPHRADVLDVERLDPEDRRLLVLRDGCGTAEWSEAGFPVDTSTSGTAAWRASYGVAVGGEIVAAGNMTDWRGAPADVGLLTRPDHRGRGLATRVAVAMISDWLPQVGLIRYRTMTTNKPSLAVARRLGFEGYGQNILAHRRAV